MTHKNQSGRTMMEMLGVLAIIGIITYGAISGINSGMTSYRINALYIEVSDIIHGLQDMYTAVYGGGNFPNSVCDTDAIDSVSCQALIKNGILSKNAIDLVIETQAPQTLNVIFTTNKKDFCKRLAKMDWDVQFINCVNDGQSCSSLSDADLCKTSTELTFSPKSN